MKYLIILLAFTTNAFAAFTYPDYNGLPDSGDELFKVVDQDMVNDDSSFELIFKLDPLFSPQRFGLFEYDGMSAGSLLTVFDVSDSYGADSNVLWTTTTATSKYGQISITDIATAAFGLWYEADGMTYYSVNDLNAGGADHFGLYWNDDDFSNTDLYAIANDMQDGFAFDLIKVGVNDIQPIIDITGTPEVPEPTTLAIFGLGLLTIALRKRNS